MIRDLNSIAEEHYNLTISEPTFFDQVQRESALYFQEVLSPSSHLVSGKISLILSQELPPQVNELLDENIQKFREFIDPATFPSIMERLYENHHLAKILADTTNFIQNLFTDKMTSAWKVGITLKEDIEEPEWTRIFVIIKGNFKFRDFKERLDFEDQIEKWIDSTVESYKEVELIDEGKIDDANALISVVLEQEE
jgi:hypothetical protein